MKPQNSNHFISKILLFAILFSMIVIILGAYTRLEDAGLGCPDWPGCYGKLLVYEITHYDQQNFPDNELEVHKAWYEMVHRYFAGTLGLIILGLAIYFTVKKKKEFIKAGWFLVIVVTFQALLGMWTVTLKLHPLIVMSHLIGGFTTLSLLWYQYLKTKKFHIKALPIKKTFIVFGLILVISQIALGGWVSSNYAALACTDFPGCVPNGDFWPEMDFKKGFDLTLEIGPDYEFGHLDSSGRMAIHMAHRIGALLVFIYLMSLAHFLFYRGRGTIFRKLSIALVAVLFLQIGLGVSNVVFHLPLKIAVAHNFVGSLLLLVMISIYYCSKKEVEKFTDKPVISSI